MKRHADLLSATCAVLICCASAAPRVAHAEESPVLARDLNKLRAPGKIAAVLWTIRKDSCTLQVVLPNPGSRMVRTSQDGAATHPKPQQTRIQVWLLRADGNIIPAVRQWESPGFNHTKLLTRGSGPEVNYSFPLSASTQAVAAAVMIDGDFYIEQLTPFSSER
jgi:hypothetical protein